MCVDGEPVNVFLNQDDTSNQMDVEVLTVPVGRRLIIRYLSLSARVPAGERVTAAHINVPVVHFLVVFPQGRNIAGDDVFTAAQPLRVVIEPGQLLQPGFAQRNVMCGLLCPR